MPPAERHGRSPTVMALGEPHRLTSTNPAGTHLEAESRPVPQRRGITSMAVLTLALRTQSAICPACFADFEAANRE